MERCDYGALMVHWFSRKPFAEPVDWSVVPERWRTFLKASLSSNPTDRPKSFLELESWLDDPELALTQFALNIHADETGKPISASEQQIKTLAEIGPLFEKIQQKKRLSSEAKTGPMGEADRLIRSKRWAEALAKLKQVYAHHPQDVEVITKMAFVFHALKEPEQAKEYYQKATSISPEVAKGLLNELTSRI